MWLRLCFCWMVRADLLLLAMSWFTQFMVAQNTWYSESTLGWGLVGWLDISLVS